MPNVLLIEPDTDLRINITELLQNEGYTVHSTISIPEIIQEFERVKPDIIILDEVNLNGAYKKLTQEEKLKDKPFVLILNKDGSRIGFEFADACLAMPFAGEALIDLLGKRSS